MNVLLDKIELEIRMQLLAITMCTLLVVAFCLQQHQRHETQAQNRPIHVRASQPREERSSFSELATSSDGSSTSSGDSPYVPFERVRALTIPPKRNNYHLVRKICQNPKETYVLHTRAKQDKGFIKEPSFSADGRIVCSPYDNGIRLLGYSDVCSEYPRHIDEVDSIKQAPRTLKVLKEINAHDDIVLARNLAHVNRYWLVVVRVER
ncbi:DDB1- and CUL4-associated factor 10 homolog [Eumeta japonica]|uniref:DDB1-and CUL4-associated factor 10 homolog n=1 Tax=Eumeta variegata TaxID=151549 RepID=A0A4C1SR82_EUMVA|nr:DDB1- and CUL4-associated factor 10 homolog [Eumeta japonica]